MKGREVKVSVDTIVKHSPNVPWRTIDGKGILVDLDSGFYFSLNKTGQFVWAQIDGERSISDISRKLVDQFEVEEATAIQDCLELAEQLMGQGLLVAVSP